MSDGNVLPFTRPSKAGRPNPAGLGSVHELQSEKDARENAAWSEMTRTLTIAQATGSLHDMAVAVRAFDTFMQVAGMSESERRQILG